MTARLDLDVAAVAERTIRDISTANDGVLSDEVVRRLRALPAMLRTSGVPATVAFCQSKATGAGELAQAYRAVAAALREQLAAQLGWPTQPADLYARMGTASPAELARAFARLEALAGWLRRLAEAARPAVRPRSDQAAGDA